MDIRKAYKTGLSHSLLSAMFGEKSPSLRGCLFFSLSVGFSIPIAFILPIGIENPTLVMIDLSREIDGHCSILMKHSLRRFIN
jgi:hypothetical protein